MFPSPMAYPKQEKRKSSLPDHVPLANSVQVDSSSASSVTVVSSDMLSSATRSGNVTLGARTWVLMGLGDGEAGLVSIICKGTQVTSMWDGG